MSETTTTKIGLRVARAGKDEFRRVWSFVHAMEGLFDTRGFFSSEEDWRGWPTSATAWQRRSARCRPPAPARAADSTGTLSNCTSQTFVDGQTTN